MLVSNFQQNPYQVPQASGMKPSGGPSGGYSSKPATPVAITVFGILHLVFGVLGICGLGAGAGGLVVIHNVPDMRAADPMIDHPLYWPYMIFSLTIGLINTVIMISAGILLLKWHDLGRKLSMIYAWSAIALGLLGMLYLIISMVSMPWEANLQEPEGMGQIFGVVLGFIGGLIGLAYPILVLYFLSRPHVREFLQRQPG